MTRQELIKALEDSGAEFTGYKRAKAGDLQEALDLMASKHKLAVIAEGLGVTHAPPTKPRANWGANENPRHCRACKSANSRVTDTKPFQHPARVVRYRVCGDCGQKYSTLEVE